MSACDGSVEPPRLTPRMHAVQRLESRIPSGFEAESNARRKSVFRLPFHALRSAFRVQTRDSESGIHGRTCDCASTANALKSGTWLNDSNASFATRRKMNASATNIAHSATTITRSDCARTANTTASHAEKHATTSRRRNHKELRPATKQAARRPPFLFTLSI